MPSSRTPDPIGTILAGVPRSRRAEVERELRAYIEDAGSLSALGDPEEIARGFAEAYRPTWRSGLALFAASALVSILIVILSRSFLAQQYPHVAREILFFAALPIGYIGARRGLLITAALSLYVVAVAQVITPGEAIGPAVAFTAGAFVYLLRRTRIPLAWVWGTVLPLTLARMIHGPLTPGNGPFRPWHVGVWLTTALSCCAMTRLSAALE